jgi:hypothetical protein
MRPRLVEGDFRGWLHLQPICSQMVNFLIGPILFLDFVRHGKSWVRLVKFIFPVTRTRPETRLQKPQ